MDKQETPIVDFIVDELDPKVVNQETWNNLNKISTYTHRLFSYRYSLLIYRLMKGGHIRMEHLAEATGYSTVTLYNILDTFEKRIAEKNEKV